MVPVKFSPLKAANTKLLNRNLYVINMGSVYGNLATDTATDEPARA